jgi:hypothetical protein
MKNLSVLALFVAVLSSCATARSPVTGFWYTDTESGLAVTANPAGSKKGQACASSILGLFATGNASIEAARRAGGITQVTSIDEKSNSILGIYATYCTIVMGR